MTQRKTLRRRAGTRDARLAERRLGLVDETIGGFATLDVADAEHGGDLLDSVVARGDARDVDGGAAVGVGVGRLGDDEVRVAARGHLREGGDAEDLLRTGGGETSEGVAYSRADATADAAVDFVEDRDAADGEFSVGAHVGVVFGHDGGHLQSEHEASLFTARGDGRHRP